MGPNWKTANEFQHVIKMPEEWANEKRKEPYLSAAYLTDEKSLEKIGFMAGLHKSQGETDESFRQRLAEKFSVRPMHTSSWNGSVVEPYQILEDVKKAYDIISSGAKHPGPQSGVQEFKVDFKFSVDDEVEPTPCPNPGLEGIWLYRDEDGTVAARVTWNGFREEWEAVGVKDNDEYAYDFKPDEHDFSFYWVKQLEPAVPDAKPYQLKRLPDHWDPHGLG